MWSTWRTHFTVLYSSVWERLCVQRTWWELSWVQTRVERGRRWRRREEERCSRKGVGGRKNIADIPDDLCRVLEGRRSLIFRLCSVFFLSVVSDLRTGERGVCDLSSECDREDSQRDFVICPWQLFSRTKNNPDVGNKTQLESNNPWHLYINLRFASL